SVIIVEADVEIGEIAPMLDADTLDQLLRRNALGLRLEHDWRAMGIVGADINAVFTPQALKPGPYISLDIFHQMAEMNRTIGIGQGGSDKYVARHGVYGCGAGLNKDPLLCHR